MTNKQKILQLMVFFTEAEKLKTTLRHSWTNDKNRQESSAEHSWMLCLIAISLFDHLETKVDQLKVLKILIIHDLAEAVTGDIPAFDTEGRKNKKEREKKALEQMIKNLPENTKKELRTLFEEYEKKETKESLVAQAIDKIESPFQHNISDIETWDNNDFTVHGRYKEKYAQFDSFLKELRKELENMSRKKITDAKQLHRLPNEIQKFYNKLNNDEK